ncbi:hypothetical protein PR048_029933 [Dryococelus australis]|uniref:Uncharacterized protein n=1 Tax=Dryococelus australis TaxID=614101 RepID=A0ABQ9G7K8_9NEOP|nr:hypothetical protein PR048_029933 [Dryococelus australis]
MAGRPKLGGLTPPHPFTPRTPRPPSSRNFPSSSAALHFAFALSQMASTRLLASMLAPPLHLSASPAGGGGGDVMPVSYHLCQSFHECPPGGGDGTTSASLGEGEERGGSTTHRAGPPITGAHVWYELQRAKVRDRLKRCRKGRRDRLKRCRKGRRDRLKRCRKGRRGRLKRCRKGRRDRLKRCRKGRRDRLKRYNQIPKKQCEKYELNSGDPDGYSLSLSLSTDVPSASDRTYLRQCGGVPYCWRKESSSVVELVSSWQNDSLLYGAVTFASHTSRTDFNFPEEHVNGCGKQPPHFLRPLSFCSCFTVLSSHHTQFRPSQTRRVIVSLLHVIVMQYRIVSSIVSEQQLRSHISNYTLKDHLPYTARKKEKNLVTSAISSIYAVLPLVAANGTDHSRKFRALAKLSALSQTPTASACELELSQRCSHFVRFSGDCIDAVRICGYQSIGVGCVVVCLLGAALGVLCCRLRRLKCQDDVVAMAKETASMAGSAALQTTTEDRLDRFSCSSRDPPPPPPSFVVNTRLLGYISLATKSTARGTLYAPLQHISASLLNSISGAIKTLVTRSIAANPRTPPNMACAVRPRVLAPVTHRVFVRTTAPGLIIGSAAGEPGPHLSCFSFSRLFYVNVRVSVVGVAVKLPSSLPAGVNRRDLTAALNIDVLRADEGEGRCVGSNAGIQGRGGGTDIPEINPPTAGIVRRESHVRKSRGDSTQESNPIRLVQSLALSGDGALIARGNVALIAPALLGLERGEKLLQVGGDLNENQSIVTGRGSTMASAVSIFLPRSITSRLQTVHARLLGEGRLLPTTLMLLYYAMHGLKKGDFSRGHQRLHITAWDDSPELR